MRDTIKLKDSVGKLVEAIADLQNEYRESGLSFTPDGKLVGDIGEAIASEVFGVELKPDGSPGVDGYKWHNGRKVSVQVKATGGAKYGPAFRKLSEEKRAEYLLFFYLDYANCEAEIVYNGPEQPVLKLIGGNWASGQRMVSRNKITELQANTDDQLDRLM